MKCSTELCDLIHVWQLCLDLQSKTMVVAETICTIFNTSNKLKMLIWSHRLKFCTSINFMVFVFTRLTFYFVISYCMEDCFCGLSKFSIGYLLLQNLVIMMPAHCRKLITWTKTKLANLVTPKFPLTHRKTIFTVHSII